MLQFEDLKISDRIIIIKNLPNAEGFFMAICISIFKLGNFQIFKLVR